MHIHKATQWWYGGMVVQYGGMAVPGFALAAMCDLSLEARLFSRLSLGRVSLSAPSSTPVRLFACACVSMDDPEVITATTPQLHPRTRHAHNALGACESLPRSPRGSWTVRLQGWCHGVAETMSGRGKGGNGLGKGGAIPMFSTCLLYTSPSPRD